MMSLRIVVSTALVLVVIVDWTKAFPAEDKQAIINGLALADERDEETTALERDLVNYLLGRRLLLVKRRNPPNSIEDLQLKRNYWRQCAFNAVSCFGK
ncbi:prohormone-1-like [Copidosoma floridanum]|uniref:prohormone-1-like n=1 Tax=Copidosoma floridanum TaxID=29053 RepID=UPI0006C9C82E|nr:prohormone-1-like [Copidosoma floridanum]